MAPFGATLHVVGRDRNRLEASLAAFARDRGAVVEPGVTSLEDVFIEFMGHTRDNAA